MWLKIKVIFRWLFTKHFKKSYSALVFTALTPTLLVMASDGARPMDLTLIAIWFIVFLRWNFQQYNLINVQDEGLYQLYHLVETGQTVIGKIKKENPKLYQEIMTFITKIER